LAGTALPHGSNAEAKYRLFRIAAIRHELNINAHKKGPPAVPTAQV